MTVENVNFYVTLFVSTKAQWYRKQVMRVLRYPLVFMDIAY